jgi:signal peptidase I
VDADGTPHAGSAPHDDAASDAVEGVVEELSGDVQAIDAPARPSKKRRAARVLREWVIVIVCAVLLAVVVRDFIAQTFYIPSGSMEQTLAIGDRILVNKLAYHFHAIHRGDIIVFSRPANEEGECSGPPVPDLVKRVIGLPGETISSKGNAVLINGRVLHETWLPPDGHDLGTTPIPTTVIPAGHLFVMGDNRPNSCDSRMWGTITTSSVVGEVQFIIWPPTHWGFPG